MAKSVVPAAKCQLKGAECGASAIASEPSYVNAESGLRGSSRVDIDLAHKGTTVSGMNYVALSHGQRGLCSLPHDTALNRPGRKKE